MPHDEQPGNRTDRADARRSAFRADPRDREIIRLALPALGSLVAEPLYILADTAVVGRLGTDPLAALAIASTALLTGYSLFIFLTYGTTAAVARLTGAQDHREAAHQGVQSMWLSLLIGLVLAGVGAAVAEPLLALLGADGDVLTLSLVYFRVSLVGFPALLLTLAGTGYLRGLQDTRTPLFVAVGSSVLNLAVEIVLIFGLGFGIGASAAATVLAQWSAAGVYLVWVGRAVRAHRVPLRPHGRSIAALARVGSALFVRTVALRGVLTIGVAVAARVSTVAVAAYQVAFQIWNLLALGLDAIAIAGQALIGRYLGAADVVRARAAGRRMLEWGVVAGIASGIVVGIGHAALPRLFTDDPAVIVAASSLLVLTAVSQPVNGVAFTLDGLLIGAGDVRFLAVAMAIGLAVFTPLAVVVAVADLGVDWLWGALIVWMASRVALLGWRWRSGTWAVTGAVRTS